MADVELSKSGINENRLKLVVALTATYLVAEVIGGILTQSLALLADAGHMLTDVGGLVLALFSIRMAKRPANPNRTYGYYRAEILAALTNAVVLIGISFYILYEAYERFKAPPDIASGAMFVVALIGLMVNFVGLMILRKGSAQSLNMKGAYFEVVSDFLTSIGVLVAAAIVYFTGLTYVDALISAGIGLFILPRTWILLKDAVGVLLEGTPSDVNIADLREKISKLPGVKGVHDLHVWSLTSGKNAVSAHVTISQNYMSDDVLANLNELVKVRFSISHSSFQLEYKDFAESVAHL